MLQRLREEVFSARQAQEPLQDPFRRQAVQVPDLQLRHLGLRLAQEAHPGPHRRPPIPVRSATKDLLETLHKQNSA